MNYRSALPFFAAALLTLLLVGCATSPTGRSQLMLVSPQQLTKMGLESFQQMREAGKFAQAPRKEAYVSCVVDALVETLPPKWRQEQWKVAIIDDDTANAFALPGGRIGVNLGMFDVATNQALLATVLGHELAHVVAHHPAERVSDRMAVKTGLTLAGAYAATQEGDQQLLLGLLGVGSQVGILLPFSRVQESEADTLGQRYMARAGFDPRAAVTLWQKMQSKGGSRPPAFLSTHPSPDDRAQHLRQQAQELMPVYQQARATGHTPNCHL